MVTEADVLEFLRERKRATLTEVATALNIRKYGPTSAYSFLDSLRSKKLIEKVGEYWVLTGTPMPETKPPTLLEVKTLVEAMAKAISEAVAAREVPSSEWELARKPMETEIEAEREKELQRLLVKPDIGIEVAKKELMPFSTGTFIDELFLDEEGRSLRGIPYGGQFAITGLPGAGKSILVEEIAINVAQMGKKVLFVTAEDVWKAPTPRFDLQARLIKKAEILGYDWSEIAKNLFIMDTVTFSELRDWETFAETYRYIIEKEKIDLVVIDSVTVLETYRGALKYRIMELCRFDQLHGVTALFVNQRSRETWDTYEMAGGIGLAHNLDGTIIIDYGRIYHLDQQEDLKARRGEFVRIVRILDCRLCNFDRRRIQIEITSDGFVRPVRREVDP